MSIDGMRNGDDFEGGGPGFVLSGGINEGEDGSELGLGGPVLEMGDVESNSLENEVLIDVNSGGNRYESMLPCRSLHVPLELGSHANQGLINVPLNGNGCEVNADLGSSFGPSNGNSVMDLNLQLGLNDGTSSSSAPVVSRATEGSGLRVPWSGLSLEGPVVEMGIAGSDDFENEGLNNVRFGGNGNENEFNAQDIFFNIIQDGIENERDVNIGVLPVFNELVLNCGPNGNDVLGMTNTLFGMSDGASSSRAVSNAADRGSCDCDLYNKRVKLHSCMMSHGHLEGMVLDNFITCEFCSIDNQLVSGNSSEIDETHVISIQSNEILHADISDDLLHKVFSLLDPDDLCRASGVCRQWRIAGSHEDLWRNIKFENRRITWEQFDDMCHRYPNVVSVYLSNVPNIHSLATTAVFLLRNLEVLILSEGALLKSFFQAMSECRMLKNLTISHATLGDGMQRISIQHGRLSLLQLLNCRLPIISISCPNLETLSLKRSSMSRVALNTPLLRNLDISRCEEFVDAAICFAITSCLLLESLVMTNSCAGDGTLRVIASSCENLRILKASYCQNFTFESVRLPMLTVLMLHCCDSITSASIGGISHSYALETLELSRCNSLTFLDLDLPCLKHVKVVGCRKFTEITLRSNMLSSIDVSECPIQSVNITSRALSKLILKNQESLTILALKCEGLLEVDLNGCEALTNSVCEVFNDRGGCPMVKSLILDNCKGLTTASFCTSSLFTLSLANCHAITSLILKCPFLEQLSLDGCDNLDKALFSPVGLVTLNLGIFPKLRVLQIEASQLISLVLLGCGQLSEASINCPHLISLDASFCSQLKHDFLSATSSSCPLIESLILVACSSLGSDGHLSLQRLQRLTYLDLSYTYLEDLQAIFKSCMRLKVLKLQACKYLADWSLDPLYKEGVLSDLSELDLSYCTFSQLAIEGVLTCCTHLSRVSLSGCVNMRDFELPSQQATYMIQELNCIGCPNVKKFVIPSTARCLNLSSVNFLLSVYLREVDIACSNLCYLNLSNCGSLKILKLKCPRLSSLVLQSCNIEDEAIKEAISSCSMLETLDVRFCSKIYTTSKGKLLEACPTLKRLLA